MASPGSGSKSIHAGITDRLLIQLREQGDTPAWSSVSWGYNLFYIQFPVSMCKPVQLPAETTEPMIFMKSATVILLIGKVVFSLVLPGNGPDRVSYIVLVYHMTNQITKSISALW